VEQQYLLLLLEHGPTRLGMIASRMGLPRQTIERVVESEWLIRADLIAKDEKSQRHLTARGLDHAALLKAGLGYD
jgi:Holliday junction resolvasome RuvABC ATP-dependent DNA helicase subunit